jgi:hypothetical protein
MISSAELIGGFNTDFDTVNLHRPTSKLHRAAPSPHAASHCPTALHPPTQSRAPASMVHSAVVVHASSCADGASHQGLTLVHFSGQRKRFLYGIGVACRGYLGDVYEV